jgi:ferritin-like metal-binding protein YciE
MEKMRDLKDLLIHEIQDLYSAEEQIIEALPSMIEVAKDGKLVKALKDHLKVTEKQKERLDEVRRLLNTEDYEQRPEEGSKKGFFGGFFGGPSSSRQVCLGMQGLIEEGRRVMQEEMSPEVLDAAIIASAQKIEHYEICGYGTARAYARELNLGDVAERLEETLDEEYQADDLLTDLAVGGLNEDAEIGSIRRTGSASKGKSNGKRTGNNREGGAMKASSNGRGASKASLRTNKSTGASRRRSKNSSAKAKSTVSKSAKSSRSRGNK